MRHLLLASMLTGCAPQLYTPAYLACLEDPDTCEQERWSWDVPDNDWPSVGPPTGTEAEGWFDGDVPPDLRMPDQFGNEVSLWQFYGRVVLLDVSTMWCAPCQELARTTEETAQAFADEGFVYLTVLQQDVDGGTVDVEEINLWVDDFELTAPVLGETVEDGLTEPLAPQGEFPILVLIDERMRIDHRIVPKTDAAIHTAVDALIHD